jgi:hypothetical protein
MRDGIHFLELDSLVLLTIESTSCCNLDCGMCGGRLSKRRRVHMEWDLFRKIVTDAASGGHRVKYLHLYGEPLLWPRIVDGCRMIHEFGVMHPDFEFATNATLLTARKSEELMDAGVRRFFPAMSTLRPDVFAILRRGADFETVRRNIHNLITVAERRARVEVQLLWSRLNADETIESFREEFGPAPHVSIRPIMTVRHATEINGPRTLTVDNVVHAGCPKIRKYLIVQSSGLCVTCCWDWTEEQTIGDMRTMSIDEVWSGESLGRLERDLRRGVLDRLPQCSRCLAGPQQPEA